MHIAVTGGSGRIGRAVIALARAQGHAVTSIDQTPPAAEQARADVPFTQANLTQCGDVERALRGSNAVIHLAAIPSPIHHPDHEVHNNNVVSSYNVLSAAQRLGIHRVCQASSVNAIGAAFSRWPHYDYFPIDEEHPTYNEDPYSLSKWLCEQQGDSFGRRYEEMTIASLRFHWVVPDLDDIVRHVPYLGEVLVKQLWGYTLLREAARACLLALTATYSGHETFFIIAPDTVVDTPSAHLARQHWPHVPLVKEMPGVEGFYDCSKAARFLGWQHPAR